jgi:hypothetical protein
VLFQSWVNLAILDLSSPHGFSINNSIDPDQFSLQYITFDDVVAMVAKLGRGTLMAKFDVQSHTTMWLFYPPNATCLA